MHYLVYKTTNLTNGKFYTGAHVTDTKDDEYLGSGNLIKCAIKKYGRKNFTQEILFEASSPEEMYAKEAVLVVVGPESYNLMSGGLGRQKGLKHSEETRAKMRAAQMGHTVSDDAKTKNSAAHIGNQYCVGRRYSAETKAKMSAAKMGNQNGASRHLRKAA